MSKPTVRRYLKLLAPGTPRNAGESLDRLGLGTPGGIGERLLARLVRGALSRTQG